jgi:UDP-N-acetylmuramyl pentapeptide synthase
MLESFPGESFAVPDAAAAAELADSLVASGDLVLVKGSRGVGLEVVAEALAHDRSSPSSPEAGA